MEHQQNGSGRRAGPTDQHELKQRLADAYAARRPLEDAESLGIASAAELDKLAAWKRYCVELSRLPDLAMWPRLVETDWPKQPA
jgi:hypothetical protein